MYAEKNVKRIYIKWQMHLHYTSGNQNHLAQTLQSEVVATKSFPSFFEEETSKTPSVI